MMMRSILSLFARSPFHALQNLSAKVKDCSYEVPRLFDAFFEGDYERMRAISERISHKEHEADVVKIRARDELPRTLFLPVDRRDFLDVLSSLDAVADCAEDVGVLFTLREMEAHEELVEPLIALVDQVMCVIDKLHELVGGIDELVAAGFDGAPAARAKAIMDEVGRLEHEADIIQDDLARRLFEIEDAIKPGSLFIWNKIFNKIGDMANHAERACNRMRLFLAK